MKQNQSSYVPEVDALRCIAVVMVLFFHDRLLPFGWAGVWIFFVISGFSITTSLLRSADGDARGTLIKNFYVRRSLRIWPLYFLYFGGAFLIAALLHMHWPSGQILSLATFTDNYYEMFHLNRINPARWYIGPLWTLSVEEQFYLLYPLAFAFLSRTRLGWFLGAVIVLCPLMRIAMGHYAALHGDQFPPADVIYYFAPAAFDAFACGCLLSLCRPAIAEHRTMGQTALLSAVGILVAYCAAYRWIDPTPADGEFSILVLQKFGHYREAFAYMMLTLIGGAMVLACYCAPNGWVHRAYLAVCRVTPLQWIGRVSYGIYIFHPAVHPAVLALLWAHFGVADNDQLGQTSRILRLEVIGIALPITIIVAALSFRYVETPFLKLRGRFE